MWPIARCPGSRSRTFSLNASATWPIARETRIFSPSAGRDAGALLAAVLQRVEAEVGEVGRLGMTEDAEDAALVLELVQHGSVPWRVTSFYAGRAAGSDAQSRCDHSCLARLQRSQSIAGAARRPRIRQPVAAGRADLPRRHASLGRQSQHASRRLPDDTLTTARDADSPNSAASHGTRRRRRARRPSTPMPPLSKAHSASATARPPSEQSCAERSSPAAAARASSSISARSRARSSRGGSPLHHAVDASSDTRCRRARRSSRRAARCRRRRCLKRPRQRRATASSISPTTPMIGVG